LALGCPPALEVPPWGVATPPRSGDGLDLAYPGGPRRLADVIFDCTRPRPRRSVPTGPARPRCFCADRVLHAQAGHSVAGLDPASAADRRRSPVKWSSSFNIDDQLFHTTESTTCGSEPLNLVCPLDRSASAWPMALDASALPGWRQRGARSTCPAARNGAALAVVLLWAENPLAGLAVRMYLDPRGGGTDRLFADIAVIPIVASPDWR